MDFNKVDMHLKEKEYLDALEKVHEDPEAYKMVENLINSYFALIENMKKTSLYDVLRYEETVANTVLEPMKIIAYENENMKKEINELRKKLGLCEKYKYSKKKGC